MYPNIFSKNLEICLPIQRSDLIKSICKKQFWKHYFPFNIIPFMCSLKFEKFIAASPLSSIFDRILPKFCDCSIFFNYNLNITSLCMCVCVRARMCTHVAPEFWCLQGPEEDLEIWSWSYKQCEPPDQGSGNQIWVLCKSTELNH